MSDQPLLFTDPFRELAELCGSLIGADHNLRGDEYLADRFEVENWSPGFLHLLSAIGNQITLIESLVSQLGLDEDYEKEMLGHLAQIKQAFRQNGLMNRWSQFGGLALSATNVQPLKALSVSARQLVSYRKLSDPEILDLLDQAEVLSSWLKEQQLVQNDFIRQLILDGLTQFEFRLRKLKWVGLGYALQSLKDVMSAYMILERSDINPTENPDAGAVLMKVSAFSKRVLSIVTSAKDTAEAAD